MAAAKKCRYCQNMLNGKIVPKPAPAAASGCPVQTVPAVGRVFAEKEKGIVKNGKYDTEGKSILRRIFCPADKLKELKTFLQSTGIETEE